MSSDVVIRADGLTKSYRVFTQSADRLKQAITFGRRQYYKRFTALDNVSFEIRKGETVGIVGRNGSGKSTLLQLVCGILRPSAGHVEVRGRISALLELGAGFHPDFTGRENVLFYATVLGMPRGQIERRLPEIEAFADIGEFMDQPVRTYSSGMFVRLAFATAIHTDPDLLVVDEALAVGDAAFQAKCYGRVDALRRQGCTVLVVSHDLNAIARLCNRALLFHQGRLAANGAPAQVLDGYRRLLAESARTTMVRAAESDERSDVTGIAPRWASAFQTNTSETRYGDRQAEIVEAGLFDSDGAPTQTLRRGQEFLIRVRVAHRHPVAAPVVSFTISDFTGAILCGTTSAMTGRRLAGAAAGDVFLCTFRQTMRLNPGAYLLNVGYQRIEAGNHVPHDVRLGILEFRVVGAESAVGTFDPESELSWEREPGQTLEGARVP